MKSKIKLYSSDVLAALNAIHKHLGVTKMQSKELKTYDGEISEYSETKWVEPDKGLIIEGKLVGAFLVKDELGGKKPFRACYNYEDSKGDVWAFGEKAAFRDSMRAMTIGTIFRLTFKLKDNMLNRDGTKTGKSVWRVKLEQLGNDGTGKPAIDLLKLSLSEQKAASEDMPF